MYRECHVHVLHMYVHVNSSPLRIAIELQNDLSTSSRQVTDRNDVTDSPPQSSSSSSSSDCCRAGRPSANRFRDLGALSSAGGCTGCRIGGGDGCLAGGGDGCLAGGGDGCLGGGGDGCLAGGGDGCLAGGGDGCLAGGGDGCRGAACLAVGIKMASSSHSTEIAMNTRNRYRFTRQTNLKLVYYM